MNNTITTINYQYQWITLPLTLGDNVILKILDLIEKNIFLIENISRINTDDTESSSNNLYSDSNIDNDFYFNVNENESESHKNTSSKRQKIISDIIKNDLINKLFWLLVNGSATKKDASLIILLQLSKSKMLMSYMNNKATIKLLLNHIIGFKTISNLIF